MEKQINIMKQSIELTETMLEGLQHIQQLLSEGKDEQAIYMFEDVLLAYSTIENSIKPIKEKVHNVELSAASTKLSNCLELIVDHFEEKDYSKIEEVLEFTLIPQVKKWKEELEIAFQPYIVS